jgi:hypothetical protein
LGAETARAAVRRQHALSSLSQRAMAGASWGARMKQLHASMPDDEYADDDDDDANDAWGEATAGCTVSRSAKAEGTASSKGSRLKCNIARTLAVYGETSQPKSLVRWLIALSCLNC